MMRRTPLLLLALLAILAGRAPARAAGFEKLFDGKTLNGWKLVDGTGPGYVVQDGLLVCPSDGGGRLFTEKEYSDFVFRCEFKLDKGGNNGVGIRSSYEGDPAYDAMECQILDDDDPQYATLEPGQYCCSIYKVVPAKRGALKPAGQWNAEEITAVGRHIRIKLNGKTVVDADLNKITDPGTLLGHPGFRNERGHIGFLGHGPAAVAFREIYVKDLTKPAKDNRAPDGFTALFDGKDLKGWKGLVADPPTRASMAPQDLSEKTMAATAEALKHWKVVNGQITYDGKNNSLCTVKDYGDFEMLVDWKIEPGGDSGIYLRGSPQVQIWCDPVGSGGLYNNLRNPSKPLRMADNPPEQWNRFRILMIGDRVSVHLNDQLVVNNVEMENYWERDKPIYPVGQIELQHHNSPLFFKNIYIREFAKK
ncbi:MAG TPA: DUF1080 domain-containing protein [Armatimonadota bacterium]|jgi:hypothetical protein